ncbi:hypothetical protein [Rhodococcus sp. SORGH_AS_0303]|uniref:hypothetical protein n=1 Tax=Rhodococcus sp. SORGH_AS_0303 TaxID=3041753 RepID=UPI0027881D91|nr:hypothetical protein [Rhodococcus sp. SORGH_AS_0303]MDQ1200396.1 hypothetical protein [Rhodococcus sp. SORGH_AS_0303]
MASARERSTTDPSYARPHCSPAASLPAIAAHARDAPWWTFTALAMISSARYTDRAASA